MGGVHRRLHQRFKPVSPPSLSAPRLASFGISSTDHPKICWRSQKSLFSEFSRLPSGVQLSGKHLLGSNTIIETNLQGSESHLAELHLRIVKKLISQLEHEKSRSCLAANVSLSFITDLQNRNRVTLENVMRTKKDGHTISCAVSSDFLTRPAIGLATSHRLGGGLTLFSRYSKDDQAGERFIIQTVHELNGNNKLSTVYAATPGHRSQAGLSWTHETCKGASKTSFSLKALCSGDGVFSASIKAQIGSVD